MLAKERSRQVRRGYGIQTEVWRPKARAEREEPKPAPKAKANGKRATSAKTKKVAAIPGFVAPELCVSVEKTAGSHRLGPTKSSSTAIVFNSVLRTAR